MLNVARERLLANRHIRDGQHHHHYGNATQQTVDGQFRIAEGGRNAGDSDFRQRYRDAQQDRTDERLPPASPFDEDLAITRQAIARKPHDRGSHDEHNEVTDGSDRTKV